MIVKKIKEILLVITLVIVGQNVRAQNYAVSEIPDSLLTDAEAVFRIDRASYEINNILRATYKSKQVITILSTKAQHFAYLSVNYNKFINVKSISAKVYDKNGNEVRKVKNSDVEDISDYGSYSLFDDSRYKTLDLRQKSLPYTVEFEYEVIYSNLYYSPDRRVQPTKHVSVEKSEYSIIAPEELYPRYKILRSDVKPVIIPVDNKIKTSFEFVGLKAIVPESYGPKAQHITPVIKIAPSKFNFDGYEGDLSDWDSIGKWQQELNEGLNEISPETETIIKNLVMGLETEEEKAKAIYEYMQNKTRYVSIQLGIGGFQPFPANTVDETGYGDCKALSFYTQTLLKTAGVKSHYTWVDGGRNPREVDKAFPNDTFNHIILCLPNQGDTLWLECTSQNNPFGYIGKFTGDRDVMIVTEQGAKITHTTVYDLEDNLQSRKANIAIDIDGHGYGQVETLFQGLQYENNDLNQYVYQTVEEQKAWTIKNTDIPNFLLKEVHYEIHKAKIPSINQTMSLELKNYAQISGKRIFLPLNLMNKRKYVPNATDLRATPVILKSSFVDLDSVVYTLPNGLHPEHIPEPTSLTSEFGTYESSTTIEDNTLTYVRRITMRKGKYPAESYASFRAFIKDIVKADRAKAVFLKTT